MNKHQTPGISIADLDSSGTLGGIDLHDIIHAQMRFRCRPIGLLGVVVIIIDMTGPKV